MGNDPKSAIVRAVKAHEISAHLIGRQILVDGIGMGSLSGYKFNRFSVTLYAGGNIHSVRKSAHIVY